MKKNMKKTILMILVGAIVAFSPLLGSKADAATNIDTGTYRIRSAANGLYMDTMKDPRSSAIICVQSEKSESTSQQWKVEQQSDGYYKISSYDGKKVVDYAVTSGKYYLQLGDWGNTAKQKWDFRMMSDGAIIVKNVDTNLVMDVPEATQENDKAMILFKQNDNGNQKWLFEKVWEDTASQSGTSAGSSTTTAPGTTTTTTNSSKGSSANGGAVLPFLALGLIPVGVFLIFLLDRVIFNKLVKPNDTIKGRLYYKSNTSDEVYSEFFDFDELYKHKIIISFDPNQEADFNLKRKGQMFSIIFETVAAIESVKFLKGFRALNPGMRKFTLKVRTTEPGVLMFGDIVYTNRNLVSGNVFESGEMLFKYILPNENK